MVFSKIIFVRKPNTETDNYQGYWDLLMKGEWPTQKLYYLNGLT